MNYGSVFKVKSDDTPETFEKNFALMKKFGMNTVVVWPAFYWYEKKTENYPFNTGKIILDIAEKYDLKIIMELAGQVCWLEYMPDFMMKDEYFARDINGNIQTRTSSSYGYINYCHPQVEKIIC